MQRERERNAKKRRTNLESLKLGKWGHDGYDRMEKESQNTTFVRAGSGVVAEKTLMDALASLKKGKSKKSKKKSKPKRRAPSIDIDHSSDDDIDLLQNRKSKTKKKQSTNGISICIKGGKGMTGMEESTSDQNEDRKRSNVRRKGTNPKYEGSH